MAWQEWELSKLSPELSPNCPAWLAEIRRGLLEYCGMGGWGMVRILRELKLLGK